MTHTLTSPAAAGLFQAIIEDPFDDLPRLLLADVLEEQAKSVRCQCSGTGLEQFPHANRGRGGTHPQIKCSHCQGKGYVSDGQSERAEFIRVQCELAKHPCARLEEGVVHTIAPFCYGCHEVAALRRHERELLGLHGEGWARPIAEILGLSRWGNAGITAGPGVPCRSWTFCRGFVASVTLTCADWCGAVCRHCESGKIRIGFGGRHGYGPPINCPTCHGTGRPAGHGPALVLAAPIEEVRLVEWRGDSCRQCASGAVPTDRDDNTCETCGGLHNSRAALAWARHEAGLPALTS